MLDHLTAELVKVRASGTSTSQAAEAVATRAPADLSSHCSTNASMWLTTAILVYDIAVDVNLLYLCVRN